MSKKLLNTFISMGTSFSLLLAPGMGISQTIDDLIYKQKLGYRERLNSYISSGCFSNRFSCRPIEIAYLNELRSLEKEIESIENRRGSQLREGIYSRIGTENEVPWNLLVAICEGYVAEGLSRETRCADEWARYFVALGTTSWRSQLIVELGEVRGTAIADRANELYYDHLSNNPSSYQGETSDQEAIVIKPGVHGHFFVDVLLNGAPVQMMVDTGASSVLLTPSAAQAAGINVKDLIFDVPVQTASGLETFASAQIQFLQLEDVRFQTVDVLVARYDEDVGTSLLGMSILNQFSGIEISQDEMRILR